MFNSDGRLAVDELDEGDRVDGLPARLSARLHVGAQHRVDERRPRMRVSFTFVRDELKRPESHRIGRRVPRKEREHPHAANVPPRRRGAQDPPVEAIAALYRSR